MFSVGAEAAMTNSLSGEKKNPYWFTRKPKDKFMLWVDEVETYVSAAASPYPVPSTLATNATDIANSVWGGTSQLVFEGSAEDAHEARIQATNPTADTIFVLPVAAAGTYSFMSSTLATNAPEIVSSVTGGTGTLIFEGTADAHETIITPADATADAIITLPDDSGGVAYIAEAGTANLSGAGAIPLTDAVVLLTTTGTNALTIANGKIGQIITIAHVTDGGAGTLTPATAGGCGWATIVFTNDGETATLMYVNDTVGWIILGTAGITTQPLITQ